MPVLTWVFQTPVLQPPPIVSHPHHPISSIRVLQNWQTSSEYFSSDAGLPKMRRCSSFPSISSNGALGCAKPTPKSESLEPIFILSSSASKAIAVLNSPTVPDSRQQEDFLINHGSLALWTNGKQTSRGVCEVLSIVSQIQNPYPGRVVQRRSA